MSGEGIGVHRQNKSARHPGGVGGGAEHVVRRSSLWFGSSLESPVQRTHTVTVASKRSLPPVNRRCSRSGVLTLCVIARDGALSGAGWRVSEGAWNTTKSDMAGYRQRFRRHPRAVTSRDGSSAELRLRLRDAYRGRRSWQTSGRSKSCWLWVSSML